MIVGILGSGGCGGTFLDWSLHYLTDNRRNLVIKCNVDNRSIIDKNYTQSIVSNPILNNTAHLHQKTHPNVDSLPYVIDFFRKSPTGLHTFYFVDDMESTQKQTYHNQIIDSYPDVKFLTYQYDHNQIDAIFCLQGEKVPGTLEKYLSQTLPDSTSMNTKNKAEKRELLSLFYPKCLAGQLINEKIIEAPNNYRLNFEFAWKSLDKEIYKIFDYLSLHLCADKFEKWNLIYKDWQMKNQSIFIDDLPEIIDHIVNGRFLDISKYSISFTKEIVIASSLLYKHNLSLKVDKEVDLSKNTLQWHSNLEPNLYHQLDKI